MTADTKTPTRRPRSKGPKPRADPAERNVGAVAQMERAALHERTAADRLSDTIARITGSAPFAVVHFVWFAAWLVINTGRTPFTPFDPFPFSFLTLVVSLEAIFLSVFVLMSQNRITRHADKRAHLDLQINLLTEQELTTTLHMVRALCKRLGVDVDVPEERISQLAKETDVHELAAQLDKRLPDQ